MPHALSEENLANICKLLVAKNPMAIKGIKRGSNAKVEYR